MTSLYRDESSNPRINAQANLHGRTHYVDDDTLRFHKSRVVSAQPTDDGLLFTLITSDAIDYENTKRGFRFVVFDLFGTVIERTKLEAAYRTREQAARALNAAVGRVDAKAVTLAGIFNATCAHAECMDQIRVKLAETL